MPYKKKSRKSKASGKRRRKGAAAVEFAVVAPVFVLMLLGMMEYGRMLMVQQSLTAAAREGARLAVVDETTEAEVKTLVKSFLASSGVTDPTVSVTSTGTAVHGQPITVSVSVPFDDVSWLSSPMFLGDKTLSSTASMRLETPK